MFQRLMLDRGRVQPIPFWLCGLAVVALLLAWRGLILWSERTAPVAAGPVPFCTARPVTPRYSAAIQQAREHVRGMMAERSIPGLSVAVMAQGEIVWSEGFGFADLGNRTPACPQTRFRIASVSKPLTAAAVARLYEHGKLDLDAPVQHYVPTFPPKGHVITVRQLALHRAGLRAYHNDEEALNTKHYSRVVESLERFQNDPLLFPPGADFQYSSYGYVLLSAVVEGASGEDFPSYMQRHVLMPLQMEHTMADDPRTSIPSRTKFYDNTTPVSRDGRLVESPYQDLSYNLAGGGFLSTAEDLVRFGSAHMGGGFFKPETLKTPFTSQSRPHGIPVLPGYGMGWMVARDLRLRRVRFHFGAGLGATSVLAVYPDQKVAVAILANLGHARFAFERLMGIVNPFLALSG